MSGREKRLRWLSLRIIERLDDRIEAATLRHNTDRSDITTRALEDWLARDEQQTGAGNGHQRRG